MPYLYFVRHGQPDFAGNYDSITALGAQQSSWLGQHFAARGLGFARVLSGTLQRQVSTCELAMHELDGKRDFARDARFNEYDHLALLHHFEGDRLQAIRAAGDRREYFAAIRSAMQKWSRQDDVVAGGESWAEFGTRIRAGVAAACAGLGREDKVLIVTSGGVIGRYTAEVLESGAETAIQLNLQIRNTGVTEVIWPPSGSARLVSFNAIPHLERPDRAHAITHS
jgi:broad specificity phosphatase PhoE